MISLIVADFWRLLPHFWRGWLFAVFLGVSFVILTEDIWKGLLLAILVGAEGIIVAREHAAYDRRMLGEGKESQ